jgi:hypothetical protein
MAEEVAYLLCTGDDKDLRKTRADEIEYWLSDGNFFGDETPPELAQEWQEYTRASRENEGE